MSQNGKGLNRAVYDFCDILMSANVRLFETFILMFFKSAENLILTQEKTSGYIGKLNMTTLKNS